MSVAKESVYLFSTIFLYLNFPSQFFASLKIDQLTIGH